MTTASRTTGVAPLTVFFDAVDTLQPSWDSGVIQPPGGDFAAFHYEWNFDDDTQAVWTTDGQPENEAHGFVAAHVYRSPGTYRPTLSVIDTSGRRHDYITTIQVQEFSGTTYYISASQGDDNNDGLTTDHPIATFEKGMSKIASNTRILFRRGDHWMTASTKRIAVPGPGIIGAYGDGVRPFIDFTVDGTLFDFGVGANDWRIMDIESRGPSTNNSGGFVSAAGSLQRLTLLSVRVDGYRTAFGNSYADTNSFEDAIIDSEGFNSYATISFIGADRLAILGSYLHDCPNTHVLRVWHATKSVISDNQIVRPGPTRQSLKFHNDIESGYPATRYNIISRNTFKGDTYVVTLAPQDVNSYEEVQDTVFEDNVVNSTPNTQVAIYADATRLTLRNNIINGNGAARYFIGIQVTKGHSNPPPDGDHIYNNTIVRSEESVPPGAEFTGVQIDNGATNTTLRNNIFYAPASHTLFGVDGAVNNGSGSTIDHNLGPHTNPLLSDPAHNEFHLLPISPAIDTGADLPSVFLDLEGRLRPQDGNGDGTGEWDIGALEY